MLLKSQGLERALATCDKQETAMLKARDVEGHAAWKATRDALLEMDKKKPEPGEPVN